MLSQTIMSFLGIMIPSGMTVSSPRHWEVRVVSKDKTAGWNSEFSKPFKILVSAYDPVIYLTTIPHRQCYRAKFTRRGALLTSVKP